MDRRRNFRLSVVMICKNEADRIERALQSVHGWADEIIVLDSGSRDRTVEIVSRYTDRVWVTDWPGYGPQRNRAVKKATGDWVLTLDADERVTPELREEIDRVLSHPDAAANLYKIPWRTWFCGQPLRFGRFSTPQARLFKRQGASYRDLQVHESLLIPDRRESTLKSVLDHDSWRDYHHAQQKQLQYACLLAQQKHEQGKTGSLTYACVRFVSDFLLHYLGRLCFLDGRRGFLISVIVAQYAFHKYAALSMLSDAALIAPASAEPRAAAPRPKWEPVPRPSEPHLAHKVAS